MQTKEQQDAAKLLAASVDKFAKTAQATSDYAPGSIASFEPAEIAEFREILRKEGGGLNVRIARLPYGSDVLAQLTSHHDKAKPEPERLKRIAILLDGVVEVQVPTDVVPSSPDRRHQTYQASAILRPPAIIGLFEAIPESEIETSRVRVLAGVQSFIILLAMSQHMAWDKLASKQRLGISASDLKRHIIERQTKFLKWPTVKSHGYPNFSHIVPRDTGWNATFAIVDVDGLFRDPNAQPRLRPLRDLLYRVAIRQFGSSLAHHVPGYRGIGLNGDRSELETILRNLAAGKYPHHTTVDTYEQLNHMLPVDALCRNILDFISQAGGTIHANPKNYGHVGKGISDELDDNICRTFFKTALQSKLFVPSFARSPLTCLFAPKLWRHNAEVEELETHIEGVDASAIRQIKALMPDLKLEELSINESPKFFKPAGEKDIPVTQSVATYLQKPLIYFRREAPKNQA